MVGAAESKTDLATKTPKPEVMAGGGVGAAETLGLGGLTKRQGAINGTAGEVRLGR